MNSLRARSEPSASTEAPVGGCLLRKAFTTGPRAVPVQSATSVREALIFLRHDAPSSHAPCPPLIVTSISMPGRSGFGRLAEVKREPALRAIPVVVLSHDEEPAVIRQRDAWGAMGRS